jgi:hypothetical protein
MKRMGAEKALATFKMAVIEELHFSFFSKEKKFHP